MRHGPSGMQGWTGEPRWALGISAVSFNAKATRRPGMKRSGVVAVLCGTSWISFA